MSATGLVRRAWQLLWQNPAVFNLVFWSLILSLLTDLVLQTRLAADLPPALSHPSFTSSAKALSFKFPPGGAVKLGLFLATLLLIVTPFRLAGLYGGAFLLLRKPGPSIGQWLLFFRVGFVMFWRGFAATLAGVGAAVVLILLLLGLGVLGSLLGALGSLLLIPWILVVLWAISLALMGLGAIMANEGSSEDAIRFALKWGWSHRGPGLLLGLLLVGLLLGSLLVLLFFARIPLLGSIILLLGLWVISGFLTVLPAALYETAVHRP